MACPFVQRTGSVLGRCCEDLLPGPSLDSLFGKLLTAEAPYVRACVVLRILELLYLRFSESVTVKDKSMRDN